MCIIIVQNQTKVQEQATKQLVRYSTKRIKLRVLLYFCTRHCFSFLNVCKLTLKKVVKTSFKEKIYIIYKKLTNKYVQIHLKIFVNIIFKFNELIKSFEAGVYFVQLNSC